MIKNIKVMMKKFAKIGLIVKKFAMILLIISPIVLFTGFSYLSLISKPDEHEPWISWYDDPSSLIYVSWETIDDGIGEVHYVFRHAATKSRIRASFYAGK